MTAARKTFGIVGVGLLLGAAVLYGYSLYCLNQYRWIVLEQAVRAEEGFTVSKSFTVDAVTSYRLEIEFPRNAFPQTMRFLEIGSSLESELIASYSINTEGVRVVEGDSSEPQSYGFSDDGVSLAIASFNAVPGRTYRLDLRFVRAAPRLASLRFNVKVLVTPLCKQVER